MAVASAAVRPIQHETSRDLPMLMLILALGAALRIWGLGIQSFTMDEIFELDLARKGLGTVITAADGFPPFYSVLLHAWLRLFGTVDGARWLSVAFGLLGLLAIYRLGRQVGGTTVGHVSALLLAISPIHVWYSQEVRSYGLLFLLAVITLWRFGVARESHQRSDWIWYGAATLAGLYTHYYFGLVTVSLAIGEAVLPTRSEGLRRFVQVHAAIAILAVPLLFLLHRDLEVQLNWPERARALDLVSLSYTLFTFLGGYSVGPSLRELHTARPMEAIGEVLPWAASTGLAAAYLWYLGAVWPDRPRAWGRLLLLVVIPFPVCWLLGESLDLGYRVRYVLWSLAPLLVMLAIGLAANRRRWPAWIAFGVLATTSGVSLANRNWVARYQNEDARAAARHLEGLADPSEPIFVVAGYMAGPVKHYLDDRWSLRPLYSADTEASPVPALGKIRQSVLPGQHFWLVYSRPFDGDPQGRLREELKQRAGLRLRAELAGMALYQGSGW